MKRIVGLILVLCLVFSLFSVASAASKPKIVQQPKDATTTKQRVVSFSIKVNGENVNYTWYFVNPATGEKVSGRKLNTVFPKIRVAYPNGKKITLKKVPDEMNGWGVYCHLSGNGYKVDSEQVMLTIYGMEPPEASAPEEQQPEEQQPEEQQPEEQEPAGEGEGEQEEEQQPADEGEAGQEDAGQQEEQQKPEEETPSEPGITQQPESTTTSEDGSATFTVKAYTNGVKVKYSWTFLNPKNGNKYNAKKMPAKFAGLQIEDTSSSTLSLKNVPDDLHGWKVFCKITGNGIEWQSDEAVLSIYGHKEEEPQPEEQQQEEQQEEKQDEEQQENSEAEGENAGTEEPQGETVDGEVQVTVVDKEVTITASGEYLYKIDSMGNITDEHPASSLVFTNSANFAVRSDDPIKSWIIDGIRFEPAEPVNSFNVLNVTESTSISINLVEKTAASAVVDESRMCKVTCTGCTFTCIARGLISATEGEVPAGSIISVFADDATTLSRGYSINGGEAEHQNLASFRLTVNEDVTITVP